MEQIIINEVWRSIDGYINYQVSNIGRVRKADTGRMLKLVLNCGYYKVNLFNPTRKLHCVHQLVAQEFLERPDETGIYFVDHINRIKTDNQVSNLRYATPQQNQMNRAKAIGKQTSSQFKGVAFVKKNGKWKAYIRFNNKQIYLGYFSEEEEAALAYDLKAQELFGQYAVLNFPVV